MIYKKLNRAIYNGINDPLLMSESENEMMTLSRYMKTCEKIVQHISITRISKFNNAFNNYQTLTFNNNIQSFI